MEDKRYAFHMEEARHHMARIASAHQQRMDLARLTMLGLMLFYALATICADPNDTDTDNVVTWAPVGMALSGLLLNLGLWRTIAQGNRYLQELETVLGELGLGWVTFARAEEQDAILRCPIALSVLAFWLGLLVVTTALALVSTF